MISTEATVADLRAMLVAMRKPDGMLSFPGLARECSGKMQMNWNERGDTVSISSGHGHDGTCCIDGRVDTFSVFALLDALRGMGANVHFYAVGRTSLYVDTTAYSWQTEQELTDVLTRALAAMVAAGGTDESTT